MSWTCRGIKSDGGIALEHEEKTVNGTYCHDCGLSQSEVEGASQNSTPKKLLLISSIIVFLVALVGGGSLWATQKLISNEHRERIPYEPQSPEPSSASLNHRNTRYGIEFTYPKSWESRKGQDYPPSVLTGTKDLFQILAPNQGDGSYRENITVKIEQVDKSPYLDEYADIQKERIKQLKTFVVENFQTITISGENAHEIVYSGNDGQYSLKRKRIIALPKTPSDPPYFLLITYTSDVGDYEKYSQEVDKIVQSIKLY